MKAFEAIYTGGSSSVIMVIKNELVPFFTQAILARVGLDPHGAQYNELSGRLSNICMLRIFFPRPWQEETPISGFLPNIARTKKLLNLEQEIDGALVYQGEACYFHVPCGQSQLWSAKAMDYFYDRCSKIYPSASENVNERFRNNLLRRIAKIFEEVPEFSLDELEDSLQREEILYETTTYLALFGFSRRDGLIDLVQQGYPSRTEFTSQIFQEVIKDLGLSFSEEFLATTAYERGGNQDFTLQITILLELIKRSRAKGQDNVLVGAIKESSIFKTGQEALSKQLFHWKNSDPDSEIDIQILASATLDPETASKVGWMRLADRIMSPSFLKSEA